MVQDQIILNGTTSQQLVERITDAVKGLIGETTTPKDEDRLLSREEVCDLLQINKATLWKYTKAGKLKSYGIGRRVYYKKVEVLNSLTPLKK